MDRPAVSVLIPAWNAATTIGRALDSVLAADVPGIECVVVDDGSTDATAEVVAAIAASDPRVVLVRAPANLGPSAARNLGLQAGRGTWLTFLDADDVLLPGGLEALVGATADGETLAVIGQRVWTDGQTRWISPSYDRPDIRTPGRTSLVERPGLLWYASATGKLFHRSAADGLAFYGRVLGDQPWTIRALLRAGEHVVVIPDVVYEWRREGAAGPSSITAAKAASARLAAEAAQVAVRALRDVAAEAAAQLPDDSSCDTVVRAYFERLVSSDLGSAVRRAVRRNDEGSDELFEAVAAFLASARLDMVRDSDGVAREILRAPLDRWLWLRDPGKGAYLRLLRSLLAAHPRLARRIAGPGPLRGAVWILRRWDGWPANAVATVLLLLHLPLAVAHHQRENHRRRIVSESVRPR